MVTTDLLLTAGAIGASGFPIVFLVDGATRPGFRPVHHPVSALALGPRGWVQTLNFLVAGTLITLASPGIHQAGAGAPLALVVAVFGLALVASGVWPMDPMRGYPPGTPSTTPPTTSRRHDLHDHAGLVVFTALPFAAAISAVALEPVGWRIFAGVTAAATTLGLLAFGTAWERDHPRAGAIQRATILLGWTWLAATLLHLRT